LILLGGAPGAHIATVLPLLRRGGYIVLGVAVLAVVATIFVMRKRASATSG
jgi:hypothetical protein